MRIRWQGDAGHLRTHTQAAAAPWPPPVPTKLAQAPLPCKIPWQEARTPGLRATTALRHGVTPGTHYRRIAGAAPLTLAHHHLQLPLEQLDLLLVPRNERRLVHDLITGH